MWGLFIAAIVVEAVCLYVPGYLLLRAARLTRFASVLAAPLVSLFFICSLGILFSNLGIPCTWASILLPILGLGIIGFCLRFVFKFEDSNFGLPAKPATMKHKNASVFKWFVLLAYIIFGVVIVSIIYVGALNGNPESFQGLCDNYFHQNAVKAMSDSNVWNATHASLYASADQSPSLSQTAFYPSAWHVFSVISVSMLGVSVPLAINASMFVLLALAFPTSIFMLMWKIFNKRPGFVLAGTIVIFAASSFPWHLLLRGPIFPNIAAFCLMPSLFVMFMVIFDRHVAMNRRVHRAGLFVFAAFACALVHPSAIFSAVVFLIPYCVVRLWQACGEARFAQKHKRLVQLLAVSIFLILCLVFWLVCFKMPFLQSTVTFYWPKLFSIKTAALGLLGCGFVFPIVQYALAASIIVGGIYTLFRREYLWLLAVYVMAAIIYCVCASFEGTLQHLFSGFWYNCYYRVAAQVAIFGIPLAAIGVSVTATGASKALHSISKHKIELGTCNIVGATVVAIVFLICTYCPNISLNDDKKIETPMGFMAQCLAETHVELPEKAYSIFEHEFVDQAVSMIGNDALILNIPGDGSTLAYAISDANVYFREYSVANQKPQAQLLREKMNEIATNVEVQKAAQEVGAKYVLLLDQGEQFALPPYYMAEEDFLGPASNWKGLLSITDETPGFKVIMALGDMRLYKIEA